MFLRHLAYAVFGKGRAEKTKVAGYSGAIGIATYYGIAWTIRNYYQFDSFVLVSANSGFNSYNG